uniref:Uncharacterized protein n=1 Tax=uncultured prokaryote TaxID=198431 RepID=A0A0H5Q3A4_9ZZZZ|nr:hypothetical protein [uncultured prokaryote]
MIWVKKCPGLRWEDLDMWRMECDACKQHGVRYSKPSYAVAACLDHERHCPARDKADSGVLGLLR